MTTEACPPHYWQLGQPVNGIAQGQCAHCGAPREVVVFDRTTEALPRWLMDRERKRQARAARKGLKVAKG